MQNSNSLAPAAAVLPQYRELQYKQSNSNAPAYSYIIQRPKSLNSPKLILYYYNNKNFLNFPRTIKNTPLTFLSTILYTVIKVSLS